VCAFVRVESEIAAMNNEVGNLLSTLRQRDALAGEWNAVRPPPQGVPEGRRYLLTMPDEAHEFGRLRTTVMESCPIARDRGVILMNTWGGFTEGLRP
jgi:hypothetical protein